MRIIPLFLISAAALGQTTINGPITTPNSGLFSGTVRIQSSGVMVNGGNTYQPQAVVVSVTNGAFTVALIPNDASTPPGTYYRVTYYASTGQSWQESWIIPTTGTAQTIAQVRVFNAGAAYSFSQFLQGGATVGQIIVWKSGGYWGPGSVLSDPTTTAGDMIYRGSGALLRLPGGTGCLTMAASVPSWSTCASAWGTLTGTLSAQTDLQTALNAKQSTITTGATSQYFRGDLSLSTFPTTWAWASLTGVPSTFPPINSGDWAGTWQSRAPSYFQTAISGAPGAWPSSFAPAAHAATHATGGSDAVGLAAAQIVSGTISSARLGSGTADATTALFGDGSWKTAITASGTPTNPTCIIGYGSAANGYPAITLCWPANSTPYTITWPSALGANGTYLGISGGVLSFTTPAGSGSTKVFSGSQALGTSAIPANSCASTISVTATGVLSTDTFIPTPSASLKATNGYSYTSTDGLIVYWDLAADVIHLDVCNRTAASITPGSATLKLMVLR